MDGMQHVAGQLARTVRYAVGTWPRTVRLVVILVVVYVLVSRH
jgi:hypothetical protein